MNSPFILVFGKNSDKGWYRIGKISTTFWKVNIRIFDPLKTIFIDFGSYCKIHKSLAKINIYAFLELTVPIISLPIMKNSNKDLEDHFDNYFPQSLQTIQN